MPQGANVIRIDDVESLAVLRGELQWHPLRHTLGIRAFGMNAYTAAKAGDLVVEEHDEGSLGHEEVYVVLERPGDVHARRRGVRRAPRDGRAPRGPEGAPRRARGRGRHARAGGRRPGGPGVRAVAVGAGVPCRGDRARRRSRACRCGRPRGARRAPRQRQRALQPRLLRGARRRPRRRRDRPPHPRDRAPARDARSGPRPTRTSSHCAGVRTSPLPSANVTPVSSSETSHSRRAASSFFAAPDMSTRCGCPRCSSRPSGPT